VPWCDGDEAEHPYGLNPKLITQRSSSSRAPLTLGWVTDNTSYS